MKNDHIDALNRIKSSQHLALNILFSNYINKKDYYPFGMMISERSYCISEKDYRFGFSGMEDDQEMSGDGNSLDFGARIYNTRLGRWLSTDPLQRDYPEFSPYVGIGNNPIIYVDFDGRDIVYFDENGNELKDKRVISKTEHKTYVRQVTTKVVIIAHDKVEKKSYSFEEAPMPTRIKNYSKYEKAKGRDYNRYDHEIAAETFIFNKQIEKGDAPEKVKNTGSPATGTVPKLDVNVVKSVMLKETSAGYITTNNGSKDVMQVNNSGDWSNQKKDFGLQKGVVPTPQQSIKAGINWLYLKGITVTDVEYDKGKIVGGTVKWTGGTDWSTAVKKYNGGGDKNYLSTYKAILSALEKGYSQAGLSEKAPGNSGTNGSDSTKTKKDK